MGDTELQEIQKEVAEVKKALRSNGAFLGMTGETLQRYFLQLNEKENLFLSKQLQNMSAQGGFLADVAGGAPRAAAATNGAGYPVSGAAAPVARALPTGDVSTFDRDDLVAVLAHMTTYEASAVECGKALRALASLAYANAKKVGDDPAVLPQALRMLALHPTEDNVQVNGMRALCNMAYDTDVALNRLSSPAALHAFVGAMARKPNAKEICAKASEAVARVVAAELGPEAVKPAVAPEKGPLRALFTAAAYEDGPGRDVVVQLVQQLVSNEVALPEDLVQRLVDMSESAKENGPAAASWLMLAKQIAMAEIGQMSEALITRDAIAKSAGVMSSQPGFANAQLAGIEAMSGLVGSRWVGLQAFAAVKGIEKIEEAMRTHPDEAVLQTKGIRALASGIQWPENIQTQACYNYRNGVKLTKAAMAKHGECEDLQVAGLEALAKYLDRMKCIEEVKEEGGTGLVKAVMMRHSNVDKVKMLGSAILETLGEKDWKPKGTA